MVLRWDALDGLSVQKEIIAVSQGRTRHSRDLVVSTRGAEILASVMPRIEMSAALNR